MFRKKRKGILQRGDDSGIMGFRYRIFEDLGDFFSGKISLSVQDMHGMT